MSRRDVKITRDINLTDREGLSRNPRICKVWHLPWGYTLFESATSASPVLGNEEFNAARNGVLNEEEKLLLPLYQVVNRSRALMLLIPTKTVFYRFLGMEKDRMPWPRIGLSPGWEVSRKIRIAGQLVAAIPETIEAVNNVLREWSSVMAGLGQVEEVPPATFSGRTFSITCEFIGPAGDPAMALYILLTETRASTSLEAVGFFLPEDFTTPFLEIGGTDNTSQTPE